MSDTTNSPRPSRSTSPVFLTAKSAQSRHVRRRVSVRNFRPDVDSSEETFSEHSSIYEALRSSSSEILERGSSEEKLGDWLGALAAGHRSTTNIIPSDSTSGQEALDIASNNATPREVSKRAKAVLETIIEQKSIATLRTSRSTSQKLLGDNDTRPQEQQSVTAHGTKIALNNTTEAGVHGDLSPVKEDLNLSHHAPAAADSPEPPSGVLAGPNHPLYAPPYRMATPPGIPSWTAGQARTRLPLPELTRQDEGLRTRARRIIFSRRARSAPRPFGPAGSRLAGPTAPFIRSKTNASFPGSQSQGHSQIPMRAPRFRLPQSGHRNYGTLAMHPFHYVPLAKPAAGLLPDTPAPSAPLLPAPGSRSASPATPVLEPRDEPSTTITARRVRFTSSVLGGEESSPETHRARRSRSRSSSADTPVLPPSSHPLCPHVQLDPATETPLVATAQRECCWKCRRERARAWLCFVCCGVVADGDEGQRNARLAPINFYPIV